MAQRGCEGLKHNVLYTVLFYFSNVTFTPCYIHSIPSPCYEHGHRQPPKQRCASTGSFWAGSERLRE